MKRETKRALTPGLRFPEFRDKPGWGEKAISAISDVNPEHEQLPEAFVYIDLESVESGKLIARKAISRDGAPSRAQRLLQRYDVIYQTVRPYQRNNLFFDIDDGYEYVASTGYAQLRAYDSPAFLFQLIHTDSFVNKVLAQCTGSNYPAINSSDLAAILVAAPLLAEQKKIAECLSSLDGLIAAEGRKLEALRAHKKGLMQQLFPRPGESVPRLRFPEFCNNHEWGELQLVNVCRMQAGKFVSASDILDNSAVGTHPCYGGNGLRGFTKTHTHNGKFPLIGRQGALCGNVTLAAGKFHATEHAVVATPLNGVNVDWLFYLLTCLNLNQYATGQAQPGLSVENLEKIPMSIPSSVEEQQTIANCLSSVDDLITTQSEKITAIQIHKKGLMQQLFPHEELNK